MGKTISYINNKPYAEADELLPAVMHQFSQLELLSSTHEQYVSIDVYLQTVSTLMSKASMKQKYSLNFDKFIYMLDSECMGKALSMFLSDQIINDYDLSVSLKKHLEQSPHSVNAIMLNQIANLYAVNYPKMKMDNSSVFKP